ncbi:MAG: hypothetical protein ACKV2V_15035 [Blastocatellia bacterium]
MKTTLTFSDSLRYEDNPVGIVIPVILDFQGNVTMELAKVDTGAAVCLFRHEVGARIGLQVEQGSPLTLHTLTGPLDAFGHEVILQTSDNLIFQTMVFFAKYPGLPRNILGRQGWLRNIRLALVDYNNQLYVGPIED